MSDEAGKTTKQDILKKIEAILKEDIRLDAKSVFARIEKFLEPENKVESFTDSQIGYVHIDEKRQEEYLKWENGIKQEWLETIENIRRSLGEN